MIVPIWEAVRLSFYDWNGSNTADIKFLGLDNYVETFKGPIFFLSFQHNLYWLVFDLIVMVVPVLILAVMISRVRKGKLFFRAGFYMPAVLSLPVIAVLWGKIYDPLIGPINVILRAIGLDYLALEEHNERRNQPCHHLRV